MIPPPLPCSHTIKFWWNPQPQSVNVIIECPLAKVKVTHLLCNKYNFSACIENKLNFVNWRSNYLIGFIKNWALWGLQSTAWLFSFRRVLRHVISMCTSQTARPRGNLPWDILFKHVKTSLMWCIRSDDLKFVTGNSWHYKNIL